MDTIQQMAQALLKPKQNIEERNAPYVLPGATNFNTQLSPIDEMAFRSWVNQNKIPFNPNASTSDYDMRGYWQGLQQQNPKAFQQVNPNDGAMHFSDYWKTPQSSTFSSESQWAAPMAPKWNDADQLIAPSGKILFDEKNQ